MCRVLPLRAQDDHPAVGGRGRGATHPTGSISTMAGVGMIAVGVGVRLSRLVQACWASSGLRPPVPRVLLPDGRAPERMGAGRKEAIKRAVPDTLDQMSIAVKRRPRLRRGHGAGGAERPWRTGPGLVRDAPGHRGRAGPRAAYGDLAGRYRRGHARRFVVVTRPRPTGSRCPTRRVAGGRLRVERRPYANGKAMEIPVKWCFPRLLFIMPAMFTVVMGPGALA